MTIRFFGVSLLLIALTFAFSSTNAQDGQRCFPETSHCISGRLLEFWEQNGGLAVFGLPITPLQDQQHNGQTIHVQWFERARLELHPANEPPYDVLLGRLGTDTLAMQGRAWDEFPPSQPRSECRFFSETQQNICGEILTYWRSNGLELDGVPGVSESESLALFGMPLSDEIVETIEGQDIVVQWFERARFEYHPHNAPPHHILLGLLGADLAAHADEPSPPPPVSPSTPAPLPLDLSRPLLFVSHQDGNADIFLASSDGITVTNLTNHPAEDIHPAWSPDGTHIAFASNRTGNFDIYLMRADGSDVRNLTAYWDTYITRLPAEDVRPTWSPDGAYIAFSSTRNGSSDIYRMDTQGFRQERLTETGDDSSDPAWSPDGTRIAFVSNRDGAWDVFLMRADGSNQRNLTNSPESAGAPAWSPDGSMLAFHALTFRPNRTANYEIYRIDARGTNTLLLTDNETDDFNPIWSSDGTQILYESRQHDQSCIMMMQSDGANQWELSELPPDSGNPEW